MRISRMLCFVAVSTGAAIGSAYADETLMRVTVPFQFAVQGHVMPAGTYDIQAGGNGPEVIWIKGEKKNRSISIALTMPDTATPQGRPGQPMLVFAPDEKQPRLSEIRDASGEGFLIERRQALQ